MSLQKLLCWQAKGLVVEMPLMQAFPLMKWVFDIAVTEVYGCALPLEINGDELGATEGVRF